MRRYCVWCGKNYKTLKILNLNIIAIIIFFFIEDRIEKCLILDEVKW